MVRQPRGRISFELHTSIMLYISPYWPVPDFPNPTHQCDVVPEERIFFIFFPAPTQGLEGVVTWQPRGPGTKPAQGEFIANSSIISGFWFQHLQEGWGQTHRIFIFLGFFSGSCQSGGSGPVVGNQPEFGVCSAPFPLILCLKK